MNKYRIKKTDILHNGKVYAEGSEIELEDDVAGMLDNYLELIEVLTKAPPVPKNTPKAKPTSEKQEIKPAEKVQNTTQNNENKQNTIQDQQNNTKDPENNGENDKNNTPNFVPPNMRKE